MNKKELLKINLRHEREKRGWTMEDVAQMARIPIRYIEALETGNASAVRRGPYLKGYKQQYLLFLGYPQDSRLNFRQKQPTNRSGNTKTLRTRTRTATTTSFIPNLSFGRLMATSIVFTIILLLSLKVMSTFVDMNESPVIATATPPTTQTKKENEPAAATAAAAEADTLEKTEGLFKTLWKQFSEKSEPAPVVPQNPSFSIRARNNVDALIRVDGKEVHNGNFEARNREKYEFKRKLEFWTDNISQLDLYYNNRKIEPQGTVSKERKLVFALERQDL